MWLESMISYLPDYHILATRYLDFLKSSAQRIYLALHVYHLFWKIPSNTFIRNTRVEANEWKKQRQKHTTLVLGARICYIASYPPMGPLFDW